MGSHTDYNQGYVLTLPLEQDTWIASRPRPDGAVRVRSMNVDQESTFALSGITRSDGGWSDYVRGVAAILQTEGYPLSGFDGLIHSTVPLSSGLSSSAALEVASALTFAAHGGRRISPLQAALLSQRAENEFVGMNCGILDQYTSACGEPGAALLLDCRSLTSRPVSMPESIAVVICDTRAERRLVGSEYADRRAQCEAGVEALRRHYPHISALRDVSFEQFAAHEAQLPPVVARRCRFIIEENRRVLDLAAALPAEDRAQIAALAAASYAGAHDLFEIGAPAMTAMMDAMLAAPGVIGARQAGAGFGGCMVAFVEGDRREAFAAETARAYAARTGIEPRIYPARSIGGARRFV
jgi:galactokinase